MKALDQFLKKHNVALTDLSLGKLQSILIRKTYSKESMILEYGQKCTDLYIIRTGMVRQFYYKDGRDISEHFACEQEMVFCIESLFLKEPTSLMIQALEDCEIYLLDYERFKELCDRFPDINRLYRSIFESDLVVSQRKADSWRFLSSKERYERFCEEYPEAMRRAPIAYIATYLLMTPETLSRIRAGRS
ncbi:MULTISPECIES: Crp/Fnr family transcriptional regulator [Flavobacterium]|uniref:Crp/Fnr family transcriptional regulator n=1 Tax=Flavobacterium TaxID=237 RepID=UPI0011824164|nr:MULTISPECIES: Crp/Fnr family transcriptional regulator [Flavobacterium]MCR4030704.1 Crp/Fnr family transcriptional regulator [Flavobacterium panacis]